MRVLFLSIILLILSFNQDSKTTILFFGDSLTAGYGLSPEQAFPILVEKKFRNAGKNVRVVNAGVSGETTAGGLGRIDWVLNQNFDVFVLELGANDGLRGLPLKQTNENLQKIIAKVRAKNPKAKIVIAGMQVPPNMGEDYANEFIKIFPKIAKENNIRLIPFILEGVAGEESLNQPDGIHPNIEGSKIVANTVYRVLESIHL